MKIPLRYQIFPSKVVIYDKDKERLSPHLSGWEHLHEMLLLGVNEKDLERLVVLELMGRRRLGILARLLSSLAKVRRKLLWERVLRA